MPSRPWIWLPLLAASGCAVVRYQPKPIEVVRAFAVPATLDDRVLEIRVPCGTVVLAPADTVTCEVEARAIGASTELAEALAAQIALVPEEPRDGVRVVQLSMPSDADLSTRVVVALHAPPTTTVRVLTRRAMVAVHGFQGAVEVDSDSGSVSARMGGGTIDARTVSGPIRVHGTFASARVRSETGAMRVVMPATTAALDVAVETTSGDIDLEFSPGGNFDFDIRTRSGKPIFSDLPVEWIENGIDDGQRWLRFVGRIGLGGAPRRSISIVTESGSVGLRILPGG